MGKKGFILITLFICFIGVVHFWGASIVFCAKSLVPFKKIEFYNMVVQYKPGWIYENKINHNQTNKNGLENIIKFKRCSFFTTDLCRIYGIKILTENKGKPRIEKMIEKDVDSGYTVLSRGEDTFKNLKSEYFTSIKNDRHSLSVFLPEKGFILLFTSTDTSYIKSTYQIFEQMVEFID